MMWLVVMVMLVGCIPERGVRWSLDGTRGLVLGDDGVRVCDVEGGLTGAVILEAVQAAWMPDGKRVVVLHGKELKTWKEIEAAFPDEAAEAKKKADNMVLHIKAKADEVVQAIQESIRQSKWSDGAASRGRTAREMFNSFGLTFFYLRDEKPETIKGELAAVWEYARRHSIMQRMVRLYDVSGPEAKAGAMVTTWVSESMPDTIAGYDMFRVSPTGHAVAIAGHDGLIVAATDGSGVRMKNKDANSPDWTADGKYLVYITTTGEGKGMETLARRKMVDDQGEFLKKGLKLEELPKEEELVALMSGGFPRVRMLKDGRILFSAFDIPMPTVLPVSWQDAGAEWTPVLFAFNPEDRKLSRLMSPEMVKAIREDLAENDIMLLADVSPDGKRVSLFGQFGRVMVMEVETSKLHRLQQEPMAEKTSGFVSLPSWRTGEELTFVRPRADKKGNEVVRYHLASKEVTVISGDWPMEVKEGWLEKKK